MPMSMNEIPYLKGIGIRIHTVRYQKIRKRASADLDGENGDDDEKTTRERRRIRGKNSHAWLYSFFFGLS